MIYDAVLCIGPQHKDISLKTIRSLHLFASPRKIFIITSKQNFSFFEKLNFPISFIDEDRLIKDINLSVIKEILYKRIGSDKRAGWYFQQFLKMAVCDCSEVANYYLIWDSDTVLLEHLEFFEKDKMLINPQKEYHKPYFDVIEKLLSIGKQVDYSFISEHLIVKKSFMKELINNLTINSNNGSWVKFILNSIDDQYLGGSGFSEFETYGNFVTFKHRDTLKCRQLKSIRKGAKYYGKSPSKYDIFMLMQTEYAFATFEVWETGSKMRTAINKTLSILYAMVFRLTSWRSKSLSAAAEICAN